MDFRDDFLIPDDVTYLNSGTVSYSPVSVSRAIQKHKSEFENNPAKGFVAAWPKMWEVQKDLASYFKCRPEELFLRANVTITMNDIIMALKLPKGSEILISDLEYGAIVNICKHKARLDGLEVKVMPTPSGARADAKPKNKLQELTEDAFLNHVESHLTPKTAMVMFSHVTTGSGFVFPIEKIAALLREKKILLVVDGAHGAGSIPLDFSKTKVDFYGTNLHKWMLGPKGTGFAWVAPALCERLEPKFAGWTTYDPPPLFVHCNDPWTTRWMICSTHDFANYFGISDALEYWRRRDEKKIMSRQRELRDMASAIISKKTGWNVMSHEGAGFKGPHVAFELPETLAAKQMALLTEIQDRHKLQISITLIRDKWCLRVAPHVYNNVGEIERAADILCHIN